MSKQTSEFQQGVLAAEKIWMQALPELLRQGIEEVSYLECGVCATRYHMPKVPVPESQKILCSRCLKWDSTQVGICKEVKRSIGISSMVWQRATQHVGVMIDHARRLVWFLRSDNVADLDQQDLNKLVADLEAVCDKYDEQRKVGWDHHTYQSLSLEDLRRGGSNMPSCDLKQP